MSLRLEVDAPHPGATAGSGPPPRHRHADRPVRARLNRFDLKVSPYLYIAPFFILFAIFGAYPLGYTLWVSLHDWDLLAEDHPFVGLENYQRLLGDPDFWNSVVNTLGIFVISTVPQLLLALWLAHLLNRGLRARTLFRMGVLIPNITSTAAVAIVFGQLFSREFGMINWLLDLVGVDGIDWKGSKLTAWIAVSTMVDWRWTGYNALIFLAAMQAIPRDLYEAAALDGARQARQFWSITVPMLRPTIIFCVIVSTIGGLQLFTEPLLFNSGTNPIRGGPMRESQTMTMYMFENAFAPHFNFGYGSAIAWMLFALIAIVAIINVLVIRGLGKNQTGGE
ncbi:cellobiose transport system permease protein [Micromonospora pattaloongensis]|uniref:Cellobiose transport system permease protein n=1 Tax=Micromonospora pattaloongensis TaxID=405436 RepID=A0A1H3GW23_9ACTN|nr:sugar ABC transporter permease [Micromonospora pattaloongensis]SDY07307.1 cellobiose transport system permease protein [Micromonospora pattaloongensis]